MNTKKTIVVMLLTVFLLTLVPFPVFGGISMEEKVVNNKTVSTSNLNHRIVAGSSLPTHAGMSFYDSFVLGSWHGVGTGIYSADEIAFMQSIYVNGSCVNYYVDLTAQTWGVDNGYGFDWWTGTDYHHYLSNLSQVFNNFTSVAAPVTTSVSYSENTDNLTVTMQVNQVVNVTNHTYQITDYYCESPLVLDLDDTRVIDTAKNIWLPHTPKFFGNYAKTFDINGDGNDELCEWIAKSPHDALLVIPQNGKVENALQLFGTAGGYKDGFEKLAIVCDKDKNGWIEGNELKGLNLWLDENNDAICQPSELKNISDYKISKISIKHDNYKGKYLTADGASHTMWDWWPSIAEVRKFKRN
jgi:hypothetical protein